MISSAKPARETSTDAPVRFLKMHGLGNDFVVVDRRKQFFKPDAAEIRRLADRQTGLGFDQLLLLDPPTRGADISWRIYNADGGEAQQCGNGARCVALLLSEEQAQSGQELVLQGIGGRLRAVVRDDGTVSLNTGVPNFFPASLPFETTSEAEVYTIRADQAEITFGAVSVGNPHIVIRVDDVDTANVETLGPLLETDPAFPERTNVGFVQIMDREHLRLRVHERGTGETRACGTGACAAAALARVWGETKEEVVVEMPGGKLTIRWPGRGQPLWMTGPAEKAYEGTIST
jgi:diaminopimelate epimerase